VVFGCLIGGSDLDRFQILERDMHLCRLLMIFCALDCEKQSNQLQRSFKRDFHLDLLPMFFLCKGL